MKTKHIEQYGKIFTDKDIKAKIEEIRRACIEYGFMDCKVMPYGYGITVQRLIDGWSGYENSTSDSKQIVRAEMRGFIDILNRWMDFENEERVTVTYLAGKKEGQTEAIQKSLAEMLIHDGFAKEAQHETC